MRLILSSIVTAVAMAFLVIAALLASGCKLDQFVKRSPIPSQCNAICYVKCAEGSDTGVRWNADYNDPKAWDSLAADTIGKLTQKLLVCEKHRAACEQCLNRLEEQKVITQ